MAQGEKQNTAMTKAAKKRKETSPSKAPRTSRLTQSALDTADDDDPDLKNVFEDITKLLAKNKSSGPHDLFKHLERKMSEDLLQTLQSLDVQQFDTLIEFAAEPKGKRDPFLKNLGDALRMLNVNFEKLMN